MNLLASESVSIGDLLLIIERDKNEKELKKIRDIAKHADSDGLGYIDCQEFI